MKHAVVAETAVCQGLRFILERVGGRLRTGVVDGKILIFFHQHELHVSSGTLDRSRLHVAGDAQALGIGAVAHLVQFLDGDVVALAVLHAGVGQVAEQQQNHRRSPSELQVRVELA